MSYPSLAEGAVAVRLFLSTQVRLEAAPHSGGSGSVAKDTEDADEHAELLLHLQVTLF